MSKERPDPSSLTQAALAVTINVDPIDVVDGLYNNDEAILAFLVQVLEIADSSDLRERLAERLTSWEEDHQ